MGQNCHLSPCPSAGSSHSRIAHYLLSALFLHFFCSHWSKCHPTNNVIMSFWGISRPGPTWQLNGLDCPDPGFSWDLQCSGQKAAPSHCAKCVPESSALLQPFKRALKAANGR